MSVLYIVFPLALLIAAVAVWAFIWAVRSGQYDDLDTPAMRMLHDEDGREPEASGTKGPPSGAQSPRYQGAASPKRNGAGRRPPNGPGSARQP